MADSIQHYIASGVLEAYLMGSLSAQEEQEVLQMRRTYPAVKQALTLIEEDMEAMAMHMAITPPPALWNRVENSIDDLIKTHEAEVIPFRPAKDRVNDGSYRGDSGPHFIEVEAQNQYMQVHRLWRWAFAAVFLLGKVFLATAIYFYIENRHNQEQVQELKMQVQQLQRTRR